MKVALLSALLLTFLACTQASVTYGPEIAVYVKSKGQATRQVLPGGFIEFSGVVESKTIEVRNPGYATLRIDEIRLDGDNRHFTLDLRGIAFPTTLEPAEGAIVERLEFDISFAPEGGKVGPPVTLVIISNSYTHKEFRATVSPGSFAPNIVVDKGHGPVTAKTPIGELWSMQFKVTNTGTAALVITKPLQLERPDDEFSIFEPLEVGVPIYAVGSGQGREEATFTIRYLPKDAEPDENRILIHSNDPDTPIYSIQIRGFVTGEGDIEVSYPDQAAGAGCVSFIGIQEEGQVCTKVVTVRLVGDGQVNVRKPTVTPSGGPYSIEWYQAGGTLLEPDENGCAEYHGTPLPDAPAVLNSMRPSLEIAVTYTAPGAKGVNGTLMIEYTTASSTAGQKEVQLCGGVAKGEIDVAPPAGVSLMFFAPEGETRRKTVVVANKGNGPLTIRKVEVAKDWPTVDPDAFVVINPPKADHEIPAWGLLSLVIEFRTDYEQPRVGANLVITYRDPLTDSDATAWVRMEGRKDFEGITLPTADPGTPSDYAGAKVGQPLWLDGSKSQGGTYSLPTSGNNGFRWFLIDKPPGSRLFLNVADSGPRVSVTPDVADAKKPYKFGLVVYAGDPTTGFYYSDEATVEVIVSP